MIHTGDCLAVMAGFEPESVDAIVTDPPYGLEFMGKEWDRLQGSFSDGSFKDFRLPSITGSRRNVKCEDCGKWAYDHIGRKCECGGTVRAKQRTMQDWHHAWAVEAFRVAKPGAYLLAFGGTRTSHRLASAIEDAGWEIRDTLVWAYASGFAKSRRLELDLRFCQCSEGIGLAGRSDASTSPEQDEDGHTSTVRASASHSQDARSPNARNGKRRAEDSPVDYQPDRGFDDGRPLQAEAFDPVLPPSPDDALGRSRSTGLGDDRGRPSPLHSRSSGGHNGHPSTPDSPSPSADPSSPPLDRQGSSTSLPSPEMSNEGTLPRIGSIGIGTSAWDHCTTCGKPKGNGYGSALKPAFEPIVMARKPLVGNLATNVLEYGTGALNIDGCRIGMNGGGGNGLGSHYDRLGNTEPHSQHGEDRTGALGRWPANVLLTADEDGRAIFDGGVEGVVGGGRSESGISVRRNGPGDGDSSTYGFAMREGSPDAGYTDSGTYSRFFLIPKAARSDREPVVRGDSRLKLRADLTDDQREYVRVELLAAGVPT